MQDHKTGRNDAQGGGRDSAAAAALHVGAPADETAAMPAERVERAPRNVRAQRVGIAVVAVLSALLIGVSAFSLAGGGSSDEREMAAEVPAAFEPVVETGEDETAAPDEDASDASHEVEGDAADSASASAPQASAEASQPAAVATVQPAPAPTNQAPAPQSQPSASEPPAARMVNVTVTVDSSIVGNPVSGSGSFSLPQGSTVYDALCQLTTPNGGPNYVRAIGGLAEFDHGSQSGWKYSVNGVDPSVACGSYVLSDGDVVAWRYVTSING